MLSKTKFNKRKYVFKTVKHDIYTAELNKKALSAYDNKNFILDNGIYTLAWGYNRINIERNKIRNFL